MKNWERFRVKTSVKETEHRFMFAFIVSSVQCRCKNGKFILSRFQRNHCAAFEVFTNSRQYKKAIIAICVLAVPFEIYWTTEVFNLEM